eukprot:6202724-Pleurochrysis_carterae.AAC.3
MGAHKKGQGAGKKQRTANKKSKARAEETGISDEERVHEKKQSQCSVAYGGCEAAGRAALRLLLLCRGASFAH